jgi:Na+-translocating ferredoxin:NAD+ oxidoreductase RnfE subunit
MATTTFTALRTTNGTETVSPQKLLWAAPLVGAIAAALNAVVFSLYRAVGFNIVLPLPNPFDPTLSTTPLPLVFVLSLSFLAALGAGGLLWVLAKFMPQPLRLFSYISVVALVLSFSASLPLDMPLAFKLGLDVMHIVAGTIIIGGLTRLARQDE